MKYIFEFIKYEKNFFILLITSGIGMYMYSAISTFLGTYGIIGTKRSMVILGCVVSEAMLNLAFKCLKKEIQKSKSNKKDSEGSGEDGQI